MVLFQKASFVNANTDNYTNKTCSDLQITVFELKQEKV